MMGLTLPSEIERKFVAGKALLFAEYQFAKTMADNPHWYTNPPMWEDGDLHRDVCKTVNELGEPVWFRGHFYPSLNLNGYTYWTMWPNASTPDTLINRKRASYRSAYDDVRDIYDRTVSELPETANQENEAIVEYLRSSVTPDAKILDVGCGTGALLDLFPSIAPDQYVGIDTSIGMLIEMVSKHPRFARRIEMCDFSDWFPLGQYDLIVGVRTSIPLSTQHVQALLKPGGRAIFIVPAAQMDMGAWLRGLPIREVKYDVNANMIGAIGNDHSVYEILG